MNIFRYDDYKTIISDRFREMPDGKRGQVGKLAVFLGVHQTFVSQILNTEKNFSEEQGFAVGTHLGFSESENEYFISLIQLARAENPGLRTIIWRHVNRLRKISEPNEDVGSEGLDRSMRRLSEKDKQVFYSNWIYMAAWLLTSLNKFNTIPALSQRLGLAREKVTEVVEFLVHVGLCNEKGGQLSMNIKRTLVSKDSLMLSRHHINWRLRGMDALQSDHPQDLFYTSPMTISKKDAEQINKILIRTLALIEPMVEPSQSEETYCLNIDWFRF